MDIKDLLDAGVPKAIAHALDALEEFQPKHWKGNFPPDTDHFDSIDHFGFGFHADAKTLWVDFQYTEDGESHTLKAEAPALEFGKRGLHCTVTVDGAAEPGQMVTGFRSGWEGSGWYTRALFEFYYGETDETHVRFDGDLG